MVRVYMSRPRQAAKEGVACRWSLSSPRIGCGGNYWRSIVRAAGIVAAKQAKVARSWRGASCCMHALSRSIDQYTKLACNAT